MMYYNVIFPCPNVFTVLCGLSEPHRAWSSARGVWRAPLARWAPVFPVLLLLQVPYGPALHGPAGNAALLRRVQEKDHGLMKEHLGILHYLGKCSEHFKPVSP